MTSCMASVVSLLISLYALLVLGMFVFQRNLMYHPDTRVKPPEEYGLKGFEEYSVHSSDGVILQLWYRPASEGFPTVVYYHGNAMHLGERSGIFAALAEKGFGVVAPSYRGYGKSTGSPTEQGIYDDARAALLFLAERHIPLERTVLYGESLGTGVAVQMATEHSVAALALQAPYTSVAGRAAEMYRFIPVSLLIKDQYNSLGKISDVHVPILIFHGELDDTIPIEHGKTLFAAANYPKEAHFLATVNHTDFDNGFIANELSDFYNKYCND